MTCEIKTGKVVTPAVQGALYPTVGNDTVGFVLFDQFSTSQESRVFRVDPDKSLVLTAYNLSGEPIVTSPEEFAFCPSVDVYKVSPIVHKMPKGDSCSGGIGEPATTVIREEVKAQTDCVAWRLLCGSPMAVIALPGYYRLKLSHEEIVGQVYVEAEWIPRETIPQSLIFGG